MGLICTLCQHTRLCRRTNRRVAALGGARHERCSSGGRGRRRKRRGGRTGHSRRHATARGGGRDGRGLRGHIHGGGVPPGAVLAGPPPDLHAPAAGSGMYFIYTAGSAPALVHQFNPITLHIQTKYRCTPSSSPTSRTCPRSTTPTSAPWCSGA